MNRGNIKPSSIPPALGPVLYFEISKRRVKNMNDAIKVVQISKAYRGLLAVKDLNLSIGYGKVFGLLGANGAGKSTSIECILGTKEADSGRVTIMGMNPITDRKRLFQKVGVQFQEANYQNEITVSELCEETASLYQSPADWHQLLAQFGISDKIKSAVKNLSGGQRQRLFIVLALIPNPQVVFLDELTTGLDAKARRDVWKILDDLKKKGMTILLTSHFMDEVEVLCDEICILKHGETVFYGTVAEAIANSPYEKFEDAYLWYSDEEEIKNENL
jgi:ABC-2 type transport system ATP-binding protein